MSPQIKVDCLMSTISPDSGTLTAAQTAKWNKTDTVWMFGLYATAVGAGTLFLPINAGLNGPLVLLLMALFAFPLTYLPHRALSRFVLSGSAQQLAADDNVREFYLGVGGTEGRENRRWKRKKIWA